MKLGLSKPVKKTMPFEDQPLSLINVVHTKVLSCLGVERAKQVTVMTKKAVREMKTTKQIRLRPS